MTKITKHTYEIAINMIVICIPSNRVSFHCHHGEIISLLWCWCGDSFLKVGGLLKEEKLRENMVVMEACPPLPFGLVLGPCNTNQNGKEGWAHLHICYAHRCSLGASFFRDLMRHWCMMVSQVVDHNAVSITIRANNIDSTRLVYNLHELCFADEKECRAMVIIPFERRAPTCTCNWVVIESRDWVNIF